MIEPMRTGPVERKVKAATLGSTLVGLVLAILVWVSENATNLVEGLPSWAAGLILAVLPGLVTFVAGYRTSHTPRSDPDAVRGTPPPPPPPVP